MEVDRKGGDQVQTPLKHLLPRARLRNCAEWVKQPKDANSNFFPCT